MKDYKKILEGVVNIINTTEKSDIDFANICTYIGERCPELAESEDEQSKKWILEYLYDGLRKSNEQFKGQFNAAIAWLEKQGEQKPAIEMKSAEESLGIDSETYNKIVDECIYSEQKPACSKKDEEHVNSLLKRLEGLCRNEFTTTRFAINEDETWLKSLKDRYVWKPSDEQMLALSNINITGYISYAGQGQELINLYQDLKKLKEE